MKNKQRRLQITLTPEQWELIGELHELTGTAKATLISEALGWVLPVIQNHIEALRIVQERPHEAQRIVSRQANELLGDLAQAQLDLDAAIDGRTVKGRARRRRDAGASTK